MYINRDPMLAYDTQLEDLELLRNDVLNNTNNSVLDDMVFE